MIRAKLEINTKTIRFSDKVYCAYCGKEVPDDVEWDHYDKTEYYHCTCEDALNEIEILKDIEKKEDELKKLNLKLKEQQSNGKYKIKTKVYIDKD